MHKQLLVVILTLITYCKCCPFSCICRWKNGKQTAECVNKDLLIIPEGLDPGIQVLEFSGNNLRTLHRKKFLKLDLINLQRLYLSRCRISFIEDKAFEGLTNLVELDLTDNLLDAIPNGLFQDCPSLMRLSLSRNPIKSLERGAFNYLSALNTLDLSNCDISKIDDGTFQGLYSLEWLYLDSNKITTLSSSLPVGLKGIELHENPWQCDCHIRDLHEWLSKFSFPLSTEPVCNGPLRLADRIIKTVPVKDLACLPDVTPTTLYVEIDQGKNISLVCQVHAIPEATVNWYFEGHLLQNDSFITSGVHILYYIERGTVQKRSELFIYNANTEDNGTFVCNAENPAGTSNANFTIKVVLKQEMMVQTKKIPFEFILIVTSAIVISVILLLFVAILSVLKCNRRRRLNKKRDNLKVALRSSSKDIYENTEDSAQFRANSNGKLDIQEEELMLSSRPKDDLLKPYSHFNPSPEPDLKYYHEQNPDLINGTETIGHAEYDLVLRSHQHNQLISTKPATSTSVTAPSPDPTIKIPPLNEAKCTLVPAFVMQSDLRLNPISLMGGGRTYVGNCYRTLPNKRRAAAVPMGRYSREAEFLSQSVAQPFTYEHLGSDVRYTADGYPVRTGVENQEAPIVKLPSESRKYFDDGVTRRESCCSTTSTAAMPPPYSIENNDVSIQRRPSNDCPPDADPAVRICIRPGTATKQYTSLKKCVGAQTQTDCSVNDSVKYDVHTHSEETVDEGYEGEDNNL